MPGSRVKEKLLSVTTYSQEFGLDLWKVEDRFKWFLASILFAKRISARIAMATFREFENAGLTGPEAILAAGWDRLVEILDTGGRLRQRGNRVISELSPYKLPIPRPISFLSCGNTPLLHSISALCLPPGLGSKVSTLYG